MKSNGSTRILLVLMMAITMTVVTVAYWRWMSRVSEMERVFKREEFTQSKEAEFTKKDIPVLFQLNNEYVKVAKLAERVLVSIDTTGVINVYKSNNFGATNVEKRLSVHGLGSGVIVSEEGHIVTAYHVIQNKHALRVTLHNGKNVSVHLVGVDPKLDIAVLKIDDKMTFEPLPFGDSDQLAPGMIVLACGNPYGLGSSISNGIISSHEKKLADSEVNLIQTNASIFPGNSGGPLLSITGRIIGINKSVIPNSERNYAGIGFAIPSNAVQHAFRQICKHGRAVKGYLGVDVIAANSSLRNMLNYFEAIGVVVNLVKNGSPAEQAGICVGDIIINFNEVPIFSVQDILERIKSLSAGDSFRLKLWRHGQKINLTVKLGDSFLQDTPSPWSDFMNDIGIVIRELTAEEQSIGARGLVVVQVNLDKEIGQILQVGDMIFAANRENIKTIKELKSAFENGNALLSVTRDGEQFYLDVNLRESTAKEVIDE